MRTSSSQVEPRDIQDSDETFVVDARGKVVEDGRSGSYWETRPCRKAIGTKASARGSAS
jgi:hypothetical protein